MSRRAPFEGHVSRTHAYCHGHRVAGRAGAVARRSSRRAAHADAVSREAKSEKRDCNPLSSSITAAALPGGATTESLRPRPLKRCWTCAMAPRAVESTDDGRQVDDQVRAVRCGRLVELRGQRIDGMEVQLPLRAMTTGLGPRARPHAHREQPCSAGRRSLRSCTDAGSSLPSRLAATYVAATVLVAVGAPVGEPEVRQAVNAMCADRWAL